MAGLVPAIHVFDE